MKMSLRNSIGSPIVSRRPFEKRVFLQTPNRKKKKKNKLRIKQSIRSGGFGSESSLNKIFISRRFTGRKRGPRYHEVIEDQMRITIDQPTKGLDMIMMGMGIFMAFLILTLLVVVFVWHPQFIDYSK